MRSSTHLRERSAFTLIELLVVIAIIATLMALLLPAIQKVREAANRMRCNSNLRQLGVAFHNYHNDQNGFPPARVSRNQFATWAVLIMPYVEQQAIYQQWDLRLNLARQNPVARESQVRIYYCPSRRGPMLTNGSVDGRVRGACGDYAVCVGNGTSRNTNRANGAIITANVLDPDPDGQDNPPGGATAIIRSFTSYTGIRDIIDGTSNTLLLGEKHVRPTRYGRGDGDQNSFYSGESYRSAQRDTGQRLVTAPLTRSSTRQFGSLHTGTTPFVLCDGSIRNLPNTLNGTTLNRLGMRADGLPVTVPD